MIQAEFCMKKSSDFSSISDVFINYIPQPKLCLLLLKNWKKYWNVWLKKCNLSICQRNQSPMQISTKRLMKRKSENKLKRKVMFTTIQNPFSETWTRWSSMWSKRKTWKLWRKKLKNKRSLASITSNSFFLFPPKSSRLSIWKRERQAKRTNALTFKLIIRRYLRFLRSHSWQITNKTKNSIKD